MALEADGSNPFIHPTTNLNAAVFHCGILYIGVSSSGKTQHFDCCIRRFESCHPSHLGSLDALFAFGAFYFAKTPHTIKCTVACAWMFLPFLPGKAFGQAGVSPHAASRGKGINAGGREGVFSPRFGFAKKFVKNMHNLRRRLQSPCKKIDNFVTILLTYA